MFALLHEASGSAGARLPGPGWNAIDGIMRWVVEREMARRAEGVIRSRIGVWPRPRSASVTTA